jgi:sugar phosphate isomerase/epimerase
MGMTRRALISAAATAPLAAARNLKTIGVQLYTVRTLLPEKPLETLQEIEKIGYREVEATIDGLDKIWPALEKTKLKPVSLHGNDSLFAPGGEEVLEAAIADAKKRGFEYFVFPYLPPKQRGGLDVIRALAERLNKAGERCRAAGLKLCYHNHAFEFDDKERRVPFDVLAETVDPKLVHFELDIFWVSVAGLDPVQMLDRYAGRIPLLHLKDKAEGTPLQFNESVSRRAFKEVGSGVIRMPAVLKAANSADVQHYFVEQDFTPGNPLVSLRQSYDYLKRVNY